MIEILINAQKRSLKSEMTLIDAIRFWQKDDTLQSPFSIAVNEHFIPRSDYANIVIKNGDKLELLVPMQGG